MLIYWPHWKHNPWLKLWTLKQLAQVASSELFFFSNKASSELLEHQFGGKHGKLLGLSLYFLGWKKCDRNGGVIHDLYLVLHCFLMLDVVIQLAFDIEIESLTESFCSSLCIFLDWIIPNSSCIYLFRLPLCFSMFLQRVQRSILQSDIQSKADRTPVTVADYGTWAY
jgi:hypothetical protein